MEKMLLLGLYCRVGNQSSMMCSGLIPCVSRYFSLGCIFNCRYYQIKSSSKLMVCELSRVEAKAGGGRRDENDKW